MADAKLSELDAVTTLAEDDPLLANSSGVSKQILTSDLRDLMLAISNLLTATTLAEDDEVLVTDVGVPKNMTVADLRDLMLDLTELAQTSALAESDPVVGFSISGGEPRGVQVVSFRKQILDIAQLAAVTSVGEADTMLAMSGPFPKKLTIPNIRKLMGHLIELKDYSEAFTAPISASGTLTLDLEKGNVFDVTLFENVTTMTISNAPPAGVAAEGSFDLNDMAAADTLDTVTVNGVEILGGAEVFDTNTTVTATAVAASISTNSSTPQYTATASGSVITIIADPKRGELENALVVATTETGFTVTSKTDMANGVNGQLGNFTLILNQDTTGSWTFAFAASTRWAGGSAPTISPGASDKDAYSFISDDGGATWLGFIGGQVIT